MSIKTHHKNNYWNDSKYLFFTPKLSLEGKNVFPQITDINHILINKEQPFLNILKKPLMGLYERTHLILDKKPVCIVGLPKEVDVRQIKTGGLKRTTKEVEDILESRALHVYKEGRKTQSSTIGKYENEKLKSLSKKSIPASLINVEGIHYYYIGVGNNAELMESIINRRQGWYQTTNSIYHFRWEQARPKYQNGYPLHKQMLNHLPNHQIITDKGNLLDNLREYCEKNAEYMYKLVPVSFILDFSDDEAIQNEIKRFVQFYWECNQQSKYDYNPEIVTIEMDNKQKQRFSLSPEKSSRKKKISNTNISIKLRAESPKKNINGKFESCKPGSVRTMKNKVEMGYDSPKKKQQIKFLYKTLINKFKPMYNFQDMSNLKKDNPFVTPIMSDVYGETSLWLLKPSDLNRGRGIHLFNNIEQLGDLLRHELIKNEKGSFILQKYLERPLLIKERKFDIRVWVMVTQAKQIFFFKQGYIRMSSQKFTLESKNFFTHLTNNAVQKHATNYGQFQQGNILPLREIYQEGYIGKEDLYSQMKRQIIISMKAGYRKMYTPNEKNQTISMTNSSGMTTKKTNINANKLKYFQIFGYDFMVDTNKQIWLIEINTNPCIELSNKWLECIVPRMLDDAMKLTLDKTFISKKGLKDNLQPLKVEGYFDDENMWQILTIYQDEA